MLGKDNKSKISCNYFWNYERKFMRFRFPKTKYIFMLSDKL